MSVKRSRPLLRARAPKLFAAVATASLFCLVPTARSQTWDNSDNNNSWSDANDWNPNAVPTIGSAVILPSPVVGSGTIIMTGSEVASSLRVDDNYTLSGNSATLQVGSGGGEIDVANNKTLTLSTQLSAAASPLTFDVLSAGTMVLNNASSRTATTAISKGVIRLNNASGLGTGAVSIAGTGFLEIVGATNVGLPVSLQTNGGLRAFNGLGVLGGICTVFPSITVNLNGGANSTDSLRLGNVAPNTYTGGASSTTVVSGPGTVWLLDSNDYAGNWQINSGALRISNAGSMGSGTTPVVVNSTGTLFLDSVSFDRNVTLNNGSTLEMTGGQSYATHTIAAGAATTIALHGGFTASIGTAPNAITGGGGGSSIAVTSDTAGGTLQLLEPSNYFGPWSIGANARVQIDQDSELGSSGNSVSLTNAALETDVNDITTSRVFSINGSSTLDVTTTTFTMSAGIGSGSGTVTKQGSGTLILAAASTRAGTVDLEAGTTIAQNSTALGTSAVTIHGATTLEAANVGLGNAISMSNGSTLRGSGASAAATGGVAVDSGAAVNFTTNVVGDVFTLGTLTGGGGTAVLNFNGPGTIRLSGGSSNTAQGLFQINAGTLRLFKFQLNAGIPAGANVSIGGTGSGTLVLDNPEQIWDSANVNVFSGQFQLNGFTETIGTVTMSPGGSIVGGGGTLILNGGASSGITTFGGPVSIACNINLGTQARVFNIADAISSIDTTIDGIISGSVGLTKNGVGTLQLTGASANTYAGATSLPSGRLLLAKNASGVVAIPGDLSIGDGSGLDVVQLQQSEQIADTSNVTIASSGQLDLQTFKETIGTLTMTAGQVSGTGGTLVLGGTVTTNASATTATIAPTVSLGNGTRTFTIADGAATSDLTLSGPVVSGTLNKTGAGKLTLAGATTSPQNLTINLNAGSLDVSATQHLAALNVATSTTATVTASGTTVLYTNNVSVSGTGKLDLSNNKMIVTTTPTGSLSGSLYTGVTGLIQAGRNGNVLPLWDGGGIVTSQSSATGGNFTSIGVAKASDVRPVTATALAIWAGQTITGTDTLVMYTYGGDATLDGKINVDDYIRIDSGIAAGLTGWSNGDFNYDGKVNIDDYTGFIDANIGIQGAPFPTAGGLGGSGGSGAGSVIAVPEPAWLASVLAGLLWTRSGRRMRRKDRDL